MSLFSRLSQVQRAPAGEEFPSTAGLSANGEGQRAEADLVSGDGDATGANSTIGIINKTTRQSLEDIPAKAGILLKTIKPGDITNFPKKGDTCTIHYEAFTEEAIIQNNEPFDSSRSRSQEFQFRLGADQVIEGMDVAVSKMSIGQEVEATIPYPYAYGVAGYPPVVAPRATLTFRIELIRFSSVA